MRLAVVPLALSLLAASAAAQLTEKQVGAQFKTAIKQARSEHAASVAQRGKAAVAAIDAFLAAAPSGVGAAFDDLFEALETFQNGLFDDFRVEQSIVMQEAVSLLAEFADGVDLEGQYPEPFLLGTGGPLDDLRAAMDAAQVKALAKVRKKLDKAAAKLAKTSNARLSVFMELATRQGNDAFVQGSAVAYTGVPVVVHTVLALGFVDSADSGTVHIGGVGSSGLAVELVGINESTLQQVTGDFFELGSPWWHATMDNEGDGLPDGNVLVFAEQGTAGQSFGGFVTVQ